MMLATLILLSTIAFPTDHTQRVKAQYETFGELWSHIQSLPQERIDTRQDGWLVAAEELLPNAVMWMLPPTDHPAFPSAAQLRLETNGDSVKSVTGAILCYTDSVEDCAAFKDAVDRKVLELVLKPSRK